MREMPPIEWRAVLVGGAVAATLSLLLSIAFQSPLPPGAGSLVTGAGIAAGGAVAGRLARARGPFHGGLVAVLWIAAEALSEPFRPAAVDVLSDTAQAIVADVVRVGIGVAFGWLGGRARR
jgi:hypothetical protein